MWPLKQGGGGKALVDGPQKKTFYFFTASLIYAYSEKDFKSDILCHNLYHQSFHHTWIWIHSTAGSQPRERVPVHHSFSRNSDPYSGFGFL